MKINPKHWYALLVLFVSLLIYVLTLEPEVTFTDNGELAAVCTTLGIAHPTGYPLFTIIGHLWSLLPLQMTKIYQLNLFSAVCTSAASMVFFYIIFELLGLMSVPLQHQQNKKAQKPRQPQINDNQKLIISLISAFSFSFALTIWGLAVSLEVYSLQALIFNIIILLCISYRKTDNTKYLIFCSLMIGLGFSNHMTTLLILPAVAFIFFYYHKPGFDFSKNRFQLLLILIIPLLIGLSVILYLPLRSSAMPEFNWGWVSRNFDKFWYHATGRQYQVWMFSDSSSVSTNLGKFFAIFFQQFGWIGIIPILIGIFSLFKYNKSFFWFAILLIMSCLAYSVNYSIHDIETYFLLSFIAFLMLMAAGIYYVALRYPRYLLFFAAIPLISLITNYQTNDESNNYLVSEYTRILGDNMQKNGIIISSQWDYLVSALWYKQRIENYRRDIVIIEKELLRRTWYLEQFKRWYPDVANSVKSEIDRYLSQLELFESNMPYDNYLIQKYFIELLNAIIDKNISKRPVYVTLEIIQNQTDKEVAATYEKIPEGFALRLEKDKNIYPVSLDKIYINKLIAYNKNKDNHLVEGILMMSANNITNIGRYAEFTGRKDIAQKAYEMAAKVFEPRE